MDEQDFMASVLSEMDSEELEAFCDAMKDEIKQEDKQNATK